jgi:nitrogen regulatory protein P-II 1
MEGAMISVEAVVRPERINQVTDALLAAGCSGFFYYNVTGQGQQRGVEVIVGRAGSANTRSSVPKTVIRTVVRDELQEAVVAAIIESAKSPGDGQIGDGKIFITPIASVVRVRTGAKDEDAI